MKVRRSAKREKAKKRHLSASKQTKRKFEDTSDEEVGKHHFIPLLLLMSQYRPILVFLALVDQYGGQTWAGRQAGAVVYPGDPAAVRLSVS